LYRAVAQVGMGNNVAAGLPELARLIDELKPREPEFYMVLGDGWKSPGRTGEAAAAYNRALELKPDSARAMRALAEVEPKRAESILARAVEVDTNDAQSWFRYGLATGSAERIEKAIALNPWLPDQSRSLAELTHSERALNDALRTDPFDDAAWDIGGRIMTEKGDFREAFFDFERAIRIHPSGRYFYDYAVAMVRADRFEEAQTQAELAARSDVNLVEAHELLGAIHTFKKEWPDAAGEYMAALALQPDLARDQLRLGMVLARKGIRTVQQGIFERR
jgi:tetratricopeptide (TPR) repeat protein